MIKVSLGLRKNLNFQISGRSIENQINQGNPVEIKTKMQDSTTIDGTAAVKYKAQFGTDVKSRGGQSRVIDTKQLAITFMKEYSGKSFEELRLEDYMANRVPQSIEKQLENEKKKIKFLRKKYNQSKQELRELQNKLTIKSEFLKNYEKLKAIDGDIVLEFSDGKTLKALRAVLIGEFALRKWREIFLTNSNLSSSQLTVRNLLKS
jgi:uncharacterized protein YaiL (DUF2058 family)